MRGEPPGARLAPPPAGSATKLSRAAIAGAGGLYYISMRSGCAPARVCVSIYLAALELRPGEIELWPAQGEMSRFVCVLAIEMCY